MCFILMFNQFLLAILFTLGCSSSFLLQKVVQPQFEQLLRPANTSSSMYSSRKAFFHKACTTVHSSTKNSVKPIPIMSDLIILFSLLSTQACKAHKTK